MNKESTKINILYLINGFAVGGAERNLLALVQNLDSRRFNAIVCSVGQGGPLQKNFEKLGIKVSIFEKKFKFDFSLIYRVIKLIKKENIHILQTTLFYADVIGAFAGKLAKVPIIFSWDVNFHPKGSHDSGFRHLFTYRWAMKYVDETIAVAHSVREFGIKHRFLRPEKVRTIHYGVDLNKFKLDTNGVFVRRELNLAEDDAVLTVVARFTEQKGHTYLIDSAQEVVKQHPKVKFLLVGDGPLRSKLENKVKQLQLTENFIFTGIRQDVIQILNASDIFVLPSLYEGLPNAVLEAMACGKPIIATRVSGTQEAVVNGETGFLIPPKDSHALAEKIIYLVNHPEQIQKMGLAARRRVENAFSLEKQVMAFENLYDSYLEAKYFPEFQN